MRRDEKREKREERREKREERYKRVESGKNIRETPIVSHSLPIERLINI